MVGGQVVCLRAVAGLWFWASFVSGFVFKVSGAFVCCLCDAVFVAVGVFVRFSICCWLPLWL